ncbi:hypothetical protein BDA99DRAFT_516875, partial [Phascolomyces articulosus]
MHVLEFYCKHDPTCLYYVMYEFCSCIYLYLFSLYIYMHNEITRMKPKKI